MDLSRISRFRARGLLETGPSGVECVRVSVQQRGPLDGHTREAWRRQLEGWVESLNGSIAAHGGSVVPESLSVAGQTVEALVPVDTIERVSRDLEEGGARVDLVEPRQIV